MGKIGVWHIAIILGIVAIKFGVIIFTVLYVKRNNERKKKLFLEQEAQRRMAQSISESEK